MPKSRKRLRPRSRGSEGGQGRRLTIAEFFEQTVALFVDLFLSTT
jgi:hypothetical protein